ncbi:hypothetical protein vseg_016282 [Gypsophila vaccaria]
MQRVYDLEKELEELEEWFCSELTRLKYHLGNTDSRDTSNDDYQGSHYGTNDDFERESKFEKLDYEGCYLYTFKCLKTFDGTFRELSIQISSPALVPRENGSNTVSEVLNQMAEMGKEKLMSWLLESMPMTDISTDNIHEQSHIVNSNASSPSNVLEAILSSSVMAVRDLVTEGLQIQMGVKQVVKWEQQVMTKAKEEGRKGEKRCDTDEGSVIMLVIIQARDPSRGYEPINEMMIGLIEARNAENDEENGFDIVGVYVAGLVARSRNGEVIHNCLWCVSA